MAEPSLSPHDPEMFPVAVALVEPTLSKDEDGGEVETVATPTEFPYRCFINTMDARVVFLKDSNSPQALTPVRIFFREHVPVRPSTRIIRESDGRSFRALSPPESRDSTIFIVNSEVID